MTSVRPDSFSLVLITLLKGVTYRENDPSLWQALLELQVRVRDYLSQLNLELVLDDAEGYAYLRQREASEEQPELPRLVPRRQLSYPVSLLLVLLRKKLAEFDAKSGETRLVVSHDELVDAIRLFLPASANEARLLDRIDQYIAKAVEFGFLHRLRGGDERFEVRRILKTFVDAQWLAEFDRRLGEYRLHAAARQDDSKDESL